MAATAGQLEVSICRPEQRLHYFWPAGQATGRAAGPQGVGNFYNASVGTLSGFSCLRGWGGGPHTQSHLPVSGSGLGPHTPDLQAPTNTTELCGAQKDVIME